MNKFTIFAVATLIAAGSCQKKEQAEPLAPETPKKLWLIKKIDYYDDANIYQGSCDFEYNSDSTIKSITRNFLKFEFVYTEHEIRIKKSHYGVPQQGDEVYLLNYQGHIAEHYNTKSAQTKTNYEYDQDRLVRQMGHTKDFYSSSEGVLYTEGFDTTTYNWNDGNLQSSTSKGKFCSEFNGTRDTFYSSPLNTSYIYSNDLFQYADGIYLCEFFYSAQYPLWQTKNLCIARDANVKLSYTFDTAGRIEEVVDVGTVHPDNMAWKKMKIIYSQ